MSKVEEVKKVEEEKEHTELTMRSTELAKKIYDMLDGYRKGETLLALELVRLMLTEDWMRCHLCSGSSRGSIMGVFPMPMSEQPQ